MTSSKRYLPILLLLLSAAGLHAGTVTVISQGTTPGDYSQRMTGPGGYVSYMVAGWTTGSSSYSNVTITADLEGLDPSGDSIDGYLDTLIGPGTTASPDEIASVFDIPVSSGSYANVTLFSGLSLSANTSYYLTLAPDGSDQINWGIDDNQPAPVVDTGVTEIDAQFCTPDIAGCDPYPPASPFVDLGANPIFTVTSTPPSAVPEPESGALLAAGLAVGALLLRYRP